MARAQTTASLIVRPPRQQVYINGTLRWDIVCDQVILNYNLNPNVAILRLPFYFAGDDLARLKDALVTVYAWNDNSSASAPIFAGYVQINTAQETGQQTGIIVQAASVLHLLNRVHVGQAQEQAVVYYHKRDKLTGNMNAWTPTRIIADLFAAENLDANWRSRISIGSLRAINAVQHNVDLPDITWVTTSYIDALRSLLSLVPSVIVRERYDSQGRCTLEFGRFGDGGISYRRFRAGLVNSTPNSGVTVTGYATRGDTNEVYSRAIGYGRPSEAMITVGTDHPTDPLTPAWDNATAYNSEGPFTAAETAVLAMPERAVSGSPYFRDQYADVFRKFKLPESLRGFDIAQRNLFEIDGNPGEPGEKIPVQVFAEYYVLSDNLSGGKDSDLAVNSWRMIGGAVVDKEQNTITLPFPAVAVDGTEFTANWEQVATHARVNVYLTATFSNARGHRPSYDTGPRNGVDHDAIRNTGLVFEFVNQSVGLGYIGNAEAIIPGIDFGAVWYDPQTQTWREVVAGTPTLVEDDRRFLANLTENALSARSSRRTDATIRLPYVHQGLNIGDGVRLINRGIDGTNLRVQSVTFDLSNCSTTMSATDRVPYLANQEAMATAPTAGAAARAGMALGEEPGRRGAAGTPMVSGPMQGPVTQQQFEQNRAARGAPPEMGPREIAADQDMQMPQTRRNPLGFGEYTDTPIVYGGGDMGTEELG